MSISHNNLPGITVAQQWKGNLRFGAAFDSIVSMLLLDENEFKYYIDRCQNQINHVISMFLRHAALKSACHLKRRTSTHGTSASWGRGKRCHEPQINRLSKDFLDFGCDEKLRIHSIQLLEDYIEKNDLILEPAIVSSLWSRVIVFTSF